MATVLVVYHSMSGNTAAMAEAVAEGAREFDDIEALVKPGLEATIDDLVGCDAVALGSPDYFSDMAGGMKDFFDRTYYPAQGEVDGKPCGIFGNAGGSPDIVIDSLKKMADRFKLEQVAQAVGASGQPSQQELDACRELGAELARAAGASD